ncbi:MAG: hypothetical protein BWY07_01738 [Candidatus Hydrogenedentes bacterium ADurb.Bin170]|jgi:hypothetical protein|nr:MAG: hypothetical protein BWY07_01738 [Candidatus Hydrogenedentes bacterium ADurb.Bin170]
MAGMTGNGWHDGRKKKPTPSTLSTPSTPSTLSTLSTVPTLSTDSRVECGSVKRKQHFPDGVDGNIFRAEAFFRLVTTDEAVDPARRGDRPPQD